MILSRLPFPKKVGPDDLLRFLPTWAALWFYGLWFSNCGGGLNVLTQGRQRRRFKVFFKKKLGHFQHGASTEVQSSGLEMLLRSEKGREDVFCKGGANSSAVYWQPGSVVVLCHWSAYSLLKHLPLFHFSWFTMSQDESLLWVSHGYYIQINLD